MPRFGLTVQIMSASRKRTLCSVSDPLPCPSHFRESHRVAAHRSFQNRARSFQSRTFYPTHHHSNPSSSQHSSSREDAAIRRRVIVRSSVISHPGHPPFRGVDGSKPRGTREAVSTSPPSGGAFRRPLPPCRGPSIAPRFVFHSVCIACGGPCFAGIRAISREAVCEGA